MLFFVIIVGGNQRDLARAKNQKKLADAKRGNRSDGLTVDQRKQRFVIICVILLPQSYV